MSIDWSALTPWSSLAGGLLIGIAAATLALFNGRIAGISGIIGGLLRLPQRLPRAVGKSQAMDLALTGRMMDAAEAERAGLVSRVVPLDKLMDEALGAALQIAQFGRLAVMATKESVNRAFESPLSEGLNFERRLFHGLFSTEDQKEGMDAFVNKRPANFKHR